MERLLVLSAAVLAFTMPALQVQAQTVTGTINGTVLDASGSSVPGAQIVVQNQETGVTRNAASAAAGEYNIPQLPAGKYEVDVRAEGFSTSVVKDVVVTVGSNVRVDLRLTVGNLTERVTVTETIPIIESTSSDVSQLMDQTAISQIPLNARDLLQLAEIQPGVQFNNYDNFGKQLIVSGSRGEQNRFLQEGVDTTFTFRRSPVSSANIILGVEAVNEFKVLVGSYSAEYGEHEGGVVNTIFKSGTNRFHGSGYEFFRDDVFDARNFFDGAAAPPFRRNQFGGALGGPIRKDKTFFFANYEGFRHRLGLSNQTIVPDATTRAGLLPCAQIANPKPAVCSAGSPNQNTTLGPVAVSPFTSQIINLLMPLPANCPERLTSAGFNTGTCTWINSPIQNINENFSLIKIDHAFSANNTLSSSYNYDASGEFFPNANPSFADNFRWRKQIFSLQDTWIVSPNLVNTARVGVNRTFYFVWNNATVSVPSAIAGASPYVRTDAAYTPAAGVPQFPSISVNNVVTSLAPNGQSPRWLGYTSGALSDDVNYVHGKHALQFGIVAKRWFDNIDLADSNFRGAYTFNTLQQFLAGTSQNISYAIQSRANWGRSYSTSLIGVYGQDTYKLRPNLTLNFGLRWEYVPGPTERYGRFTAFGDAANWESTNPVPLTVPGAAGRSTRMFSTTMKAFAPRIGFNWDPFKTGKTSLRGGAGVFYDQITAFYWYHNAAEQYPNSITLNIPSEPWPYNPALETSATALPQLIALMPSNIPNLPVKYSYNLEVQRELPGHVALVVGYVGAQSRHESRQIQSNTKFPIIQQSGTTTGCESAFANVTSSFLSTNVCGCPPGGSACLFWNRTLRNPNATFSSIQGTLFDANTSYNSLQVLVDRRFATGLNVRFNYTHAVCITDVSDFIGTSLQNGGASLQYARDRKSSRMRCTTNATDAANFSFSYAPPFGQSAQGLRKTLISGWQISSLTAVATGVPLDVLLGFNNSQSGLIGSGVDRPNLVPGCTRENAINQDNPNNYIKASCFSIPYAGYLGNLGAGAIYGPGLWTTDVSLRKAFPMKREGMNLELRADMFNAFNRTNFRSPSGRSVFTSAGAVNSSFGIIQGTIGTSRQFQLGARFQF